MTGETGTGGAQTGPWVWLALIRHPQGRKGEVFARLLTDFPEKFSQRRDLWLLAPDAPGAADPDSTHAKLPAAAIPQSEPRPVELVHHWMHKGGVVLHFAGVDSISAAETLSGLVVAIPRSGRTVLGEDEAYIGDLIGCTLVDLAGVELAGTGKPGAGPAEVGVIEDVDRESGPVDLLVVRAALGGEILVPFAKSYLRRIDLDARRVEMELPEGLVDLNA
jgi:16S rRNA processing protein RimM